HDEHRRILAADKRAHSYASHLFGTIHHTVMVDGGKPFDSIIYRHVQSYALEAETITYVSQYAPTGKLGVTLMRHDSSRLYFNHWRNADDLFNRWLIRLTMYLRGHKTMYKGSRYLHAKFIIFTMP